MAKKRKNPFEETMVNWDFGPSDDDLGGELSNIDLKELAPLVAGLTDDEGMMIFSMLGHLIESGVTPEKYATFYKVYNQLRPVVMQDAEVNKRNNPAIGVDPGEFEFKTLVVKIQMKGVVKPPMWREVEMPADMSFLDLHEVIQCVVGLSDSHLWQFNDRAYDDYLQIGHKSKNGFDPGLESVTDEAATTPICAYLGEVGDKLEYVYDFGDDWIFTVSVKKILDKKTDHPVCTAFKSELNAIEDCGGPWSYEEMRMNLAEWGKLSKKEKEEIADRAGYDNPKEYHEMLKENIFDMDAVNNYLRSFVIGDRDDNLKD